MRNWNYLPFRNTWVHPWSVVRFIIARSLVFCVKFCRSLFVLLALFFWVLCCLSFYDLRLLITPLVSSNTSSNDLWQDQAHNLHVIHEMRNTFWWHLYIICTMFLRRRLIFQQAETIYALEPLLDQKLIGNRVLKIINRSVLCMFHSNSTWLLRNHLFYISLNQIYYSLRRIGTMNVIEDHQLIIPVNISFTGCMAVEEKVFLNYRKTKTI